MGPMGAYLNEITEEIKKKADKACQMVAKESGEEIQKGFVESVRDFYSSYHPTSYDRTYSTFNASSGKRGKKHWRIGEMHFGFGIRVDSSYMGEPYNVGHHGWAKYGYATAARILSRTWDLGIHGFTKAEYIRKNQFRDWVGIERWDLKISNSEGMHLVNGARLWSYRKSIDKRLPASQRALGSSPPGILMDHKAKAVWSSIDKKVDKYFSL